MYNFDELNKLVKSAEKFGFNNVCLGYGLEYKDGKIQEEKDVDVEINSEPLEYFESRKDIKK